MLVFPPLLQSIVEGVVSNSLPAVDSTSTSSIVSGPTDPFMTSLSTLLIANVVVVSINFVFDLIKHSKDNHNYKVHLIAQKGIDVEASIYEQFQTMATLQPGDEHKLLDLILALDSKLNTNRLYIEKKFLNHSIAFLDYFKRIQHKMTLKDVKKEESYFEKLSKAFYGE